MRCSTSRRAACSSSMKRTGSTRRAAAASEGPGGADREAVAIRTRRPLSTRSYRACRATPALTAACFCWAIARRWSASYGVATPASPAAFSSRRPSSLRTTTTRRCCASYCATSPDAAGRLASTPQSRWCAETSPRRACGPTSATLAPSTTPSRPPCSAPRRGSRRCRPPSAPCRTSCCSRTSSSRSLTSPTHPSSSRGSSAASRSRRGWPSTRR
mmetsp:Transcript_33802/g.88974  ORF Transcript_33802/g.88974 Transcript_33802/m.88974 type:complete len:215 (+) Transcript_33802:1616-2260(+)